MVAAAMSAARAAGLPFQVNVTVSRINLGWLDELYDRAAAAGAAKIDLFFLVPVGRGKEISGAALDRAETERVLEWSMRRRAEGPLAVKETCCPAAPAYWAAHGSPGPRPSGCLGGRGFAFLSHTGDLQTCGFVDVPCGNVREFGFDFSRTVAAAANPLGAGGSCRG